VVRFIGFTVRADRSPPLVAFSRAICLDERIGLIATRLQPQRAKLDRILDVVAEDLKINSRSRTPILASTPHVDEVVTRGANKELNAERSTDLSLTQHSTTIR